LSNSNAGGRRTLHSRVEHVTGGSAISGNGLNRRSFLKVAAFVAATPYVRGSRAAGSLAVAFSSHIMPEANAALAKLCNEWAARERVELRVDFIGDFNLLMTGRAEARQRAGHDIIGLPHWAVAAHGRNLEPVDDVMAPVIAAHGPADAPVEYLGRQQGVWIGIPATSGNFLRVPCGRIDLLKKHAGIDLPRMYPASGPADAVLAEGWTWEALLSAAERCHKADHSFGIGFGQTPDSIDSAGALFEAFGSHLTDAKGNITVDSEATREVLEYAKRLAAVLPPDVFGWDDASNNRWLVSGKGALILNPPSAWATARGQNPKVAEQLWAFPIPKGPRGRYQPTSTMFWGIWSFARNKSAAKSLLTHLSQRGAVESLVNASRGYDIPAFRSLRDLRVWDEAGPPAGTLYHYPPRDDQTLFVPGAPAPSWAGAQIYFRAMTTQMIARVAQAAEPIDETIRWAEATLGKLVRI
jgi:ABC-type glycerol-3-phosphate transport system substrate-binding protein